jgi:hypothetical protein
MTTFTQEELDEIEKKRREYYKALDDAERQAKNRQPIMCTTPATMSGPAINKCLCLSKNVAATQDIQKIDKTQYKHIRDLNGKLVATVCVLLLPHGHKAIGISVCSPLDNFSRKMGRVKSFLRAHEAAYMQKTSQPIRNNKKKLAENPALAAIGMIYKYLSIYVPANRSYWKVIV